jgi:hypothetical protein
MRDATEPRVIERWWVAFSQSPEMSAPARWFGHCDAMTDRAGVSLVVQPLRHRCIVHPTIRSIPDLLSQAEAHGSEVLTLAFEPWIAQRSRVFRPQFVTCASVVAYAMGLPRWPLTPWGLKRELLRLGAERV